MELTGMILDFTSHTLKLIFVQIAHAGNYLLAYSPLSSSWTHCHILQSMDEFSLRPIRRKGRRPRPPGHPRQAAPTPRPAVRPAPPPRRPPPPGCAPPRPGRCCRRGGESERPPPGHSPRSDDAEPDLVHGRAGLPSGSLVCVHVSTPSVQGCFAASPSSTSMPRPGPSLGYM